MSRDSSIDQVINQVTTPWSRDFLLNRSAPGALDDLGFSAFARTLIDDADPKSLKSTGRLDHFVDVRDYGAVGDGITDDGAALVAAISAAMRAGCCVGIPHGVWRVATGHVVSLTADLQIVGFGHPVLFLDNAHLILEADTAVTTILSATLKRRDMLLAVASSARASVGDVVYLESNLVAGANLNPKKEVFTVAGVPDGTHIELQQPCEFTYSLPLETVTVTVYHKRRFTMDGVNLRIAPTDGLLRVQGACGVSISNMDGAHTTRELGGNWGQ